MGVPKSSAKPETMRFLLQILLHTVDWRFLDHAFSSIFRAQFVCTQSSVSLFSPKMSFLFDAAVTVGRASLIGVLFVGAFKVVSTAEFRH